jgi:hypothetical protein
MPTTISVKTAEVADEITPITADMRNFLFSDEETWRGDRVTVHSDGREETAVSKKRLWVGKTSKKMNLHL